MICRAGMGMTGTGIRTTTSSRRRRRTRRCRHGIIGTMVIVVVIWKNRIIIIIIQKVQRISTGGGAIDKGHTDTFGGTGLAAAGLCSRTFVTFFPTFLGVTVVLVVVVIHSRFVSIRRRGRQIGGWWWWWNDPRFAIECPCEMYIGPGPIGWWCRILRRR